MDRRYSRDTRWQHAGKSGRAACRHPHIAHGEPDWICALRRHGAFQDLSVRHRSHLFWLAVARSGHAHAYARRAWLEDDLQAPALGMEPNLQHPSPAMGPVRLGRERKNPQYLRFWLGNGYAKGRRSLECRPLALV